MTHHSLTIDDEQIDNIRVDVYLSEHANVLPRNQLKIRANRILVNGAEVKISKRVSFGDSIEIELAPPPDASYEPEDVRFEVLYEDDCCVVINKPRGMVVHPAAGNAHGLPLIGM